MKEAATPLLKPQYVAISRVEHKNSPILFFPEERANKGMIACATFEGHTEASIDYYQKKTKPASFDASFLCLGYKKEELILRKKVNYEALRRGWQK